MLRGFAASFNKTLTARLASALTVLCHTTRQQVVPAQISAKTNNSSGGFSPLGPLEYEERNS